MPYWNRAEIWKWGGEDCKIDWCWCWNGDADKAGSHQRTSPENDQDEAANQKEESCVTMKLTEKEFAALELVYDAGREGVTEELMAQHGYDQTFLVDLCKRGLLICRETRRRIGAKEITVCRVFISEDGGEEVELRRIVSRANLGRLANRA